MNQGIRITNWSFINKTTELVFVVFFLILTSLLIYLTGGTPNIYVNLYYLPIVFAAFFFGWVWALLTGAAAAGLASFALHTSGFSLSAARVEDFLIRFAIQGLVGAQVGVLAGMLHREKREKEDSRVFLRAKLRQIEALKAIERAIVQDVDVYALLPQICRRVSESLSADLVMIWLTDGKGFRLTAEHGMPEELRPKMLDFPIRDPSANRFWTQPRMVTSRTLEESGFFNWPDFDALRHRLQLKCGCSVPLSASQLHFGSLCVFFRSPDALEKGAAEETEMFAGQLAIAVRNNQLLDEMQSLTFDLVQSLAEVVDLRDAYTGGHSGRVAKYALGIGSELKLSSEELRVVRYASILHDLGKIAVDGLILRKPAGLSEPELLKIKEHPRLASRILNKVKFFQDIVPAIYHHHEKFNGGGYPDNLRGGKIPLSARILAVADSFEAMVSDRPYRKALPRTEAEAEIRKESGRQFDPRVVEAFFQYLVKETNA